MVQFLRYLSELREHQCERLTIFRVTILNLQRSRRLYSIYKVIWFAVCCVSLCVLKISCVIELIDWDQFNFNKDDDQKSAMYVNQRSKKPQYGRKVWNNNQRQRNTFLGAQERRAHALPLLTQKIRRGLHRLRQKPAAGSKAAQTIIRFHFSRCLIAYLSSQTTTNPRLIYERSWFSWVGISHLDTEIAKVKDLLLDNDKHRLSLQQESLSSKNHDLFFWLACNWIQNLKKHQQINGQVFVFSKSKGFKSVIRLFDWMISGRS